MPLRSGPQATPRRWAELALQLVVEDRAHRLAPDVQQLGVEGDVGAVVSSDDVGYQAMRVQLGVAGAAGAMHERGDGEAVRPHPLTHAAYLLAGHGGPLLEEVERRSHRLDLGLTDEL